jgi:hypothetical protein
MTPGSGVADRIYWIFGMVVGEGGGPLVLGRVVDGHEYAYPCTYANSSARRERVRGDGRKS